MIRLKDACIRGRRNVRRLRVFLGPIEIAGYYSHLGAALNAAGADAVVVDLAAHPFEYQDARRAPKLVRLAARVSQGRERASRRPVMRLAWFVAELAARTALLAWCVTRFDAFVFSHGHTIWFGREVALLRLLRRRMVFVFNGSDARPPYIDGALMGPSTGRSISDCIRLTARAKSRIRRIERHASAIVSQPAFSHFFERPVVDFFRLGVPWTPGPERQEGESGAEVRVLHSPSRPDVKGTERIREAIARVQSQGIALRFLELQGVKNSDVRAEIARADFVIDQIYSDAPMVSFATEAASVGVPAIVGGYAWPELNRIYPGQAMPPVEQCHPDRLEVAIERLATDADYRRRLGQRAYDFIAREWAPGRIADHFLELLQGNEPENLMYDPRSVRYLCGVGLHQTAARALVEETIRLGGRKALQLDDKPQLAAAFAAFAEGQIGCGVADWAPDPQALSAEPIGPAEAGWTPNGRMSPAATGDGGVAGARQSGRPH